MALLQLTQLWTVLGGLTPAGDAADPRAKVADADDNGQGVLAVDFWCPHSVNQIAYSFLALSRDHWLEHGIHLCLDMFGCHLMNGGEEIGKAEPCQSLHASCMHHRSLLLEYDEVNTTPLFE